jgi:hypothetical protein
MTEYPTGGSPADTISEPNGTGYRTERGISAADLKALYSERPVAFQRSLVGPAGGVLEALFLSQALYWEARTKDEGGWFFKTQAEWEAETGMTRSEQETARRTLRKNGILEERLAGLPARLHYRINLDRLAELLANKSATLPHTGKPRCRNQEGHYVADNKVETSPETTSERETPRAPVHAHERAPLPGDEYEAAKVFVREQGPFQAFGMITITAVFEEVSSSLVNGEQVTPERFAYAVADARAFSGREKGAVQVAHFITGWRKWLTKDRPPPTRGNAPPPAPSPEAQEAERERSRQAYAEHERKVLAEMREREAAAAALAALTPEERRERIERIRAKAEREMAEERAAKSRGETT